MDPSSKEAVHQAETLPNEVAASLTSGKSPSSQSWPELDSKNPLAIFSQQLPEILEVTGYNEVYGVILEPDAPFHTKLILQKFLRANKNDLTKAREQLEGTLKWRKEYRALDAKKEIFSKKLFGGLGYVLTTKDVPGDEERSNIVTFNLYGAVKDLSATFGDTDRFIRWRVGLMELYLEKLNLNAVTNPIPDYDQGVDPYQGIQVHDYMNVSFLRQNPAVKATTNKTIELFQRYYPETLSRKFFVNVPIVMGWMYTAMKMFLSPETVKKFVMMSYGNKLADELGPQIPVEYGGKAASIEAAGEELRLDEDKPNDQK